MIKIEAAARLMAADKARIKELENMIIINQSDPEYVKELKEELKELKDKDPNLLTAGKKALTLNEWKERVKEKVPGAKFVRDHAGILHAEHDDMTVGSYTDPKHWYVTTQDKTKG